MASVTAAGPGCGFGFRFSAMASRCEVRLAAADERQAAAWAAVAIGEVRRIEQAYSRYRGDSIVSRINAAAGGEPVECDAETVALLDYAETLHQASGGLFDLTAGVLRRAWNFKVARLPAPAELDALRPLIGWHQVERDGSRVRLSRPGMELDFGGFGKEYAADRAAALLREAGALHGFVNLGGDLQVLGPQPDGRPWAIAIQHPRDAAREVAVLQISRGGLATSGDYERFFELDGVRYCHLLHPRRCRPVHGWQSISVSAPLAIAAGSCCTLAMLQEGRAAAFLDAAGLAWLGVDAHGRLHGSLLGARCHAARDLHVES